MKSQDGQPLQNRYVLITPARNEEANLGKTIESVAAQSAKPLRWIIVNDNSTDKTAQIVRDAMARYPFIQLVESDPGSPRNFAAKVRAFNLGFELVKNLDCDFIGNLDADLSFDPDYYQKLIAEFEANPRLGVAGGVYLDVIDGVGRRPLSNRNDVPGATQLFRRDCFREIGGYVPLATGGEDAAANITARLKGWQTRSFEHIQALHHRPAGTGSGAGILRVRHNDGRCDYFLGTHPLFVLVKSMRRITERPFFLGAMVRAWGYFSPWIRGESRQVSEEFVAHLRREQMGRLLGPFGARPRPATSALEMPPR